MILDLVSYWVSVLVNVSVNFFKWSGLAIFMQKCFRNVYFMLKVHEMGKGFEERTEVL